MFNVIKYIIIPNCNYFDNSLDKIQIQIKNYELKLSNLCLVVVGSGWKDLART